MAICATRLEVVSLSYRFSPVAGLACQVRPSSQGAAKVGKGVYFRDVCAWLYAGELRIVNA